MTHALRRISIWLLPLCLVAAPLAGAAQPVPAPPPAMALEPLLRGEFALQEGRFEEAARAYLDAERQQADAGIAARAAQAALLTQNHRLAQQALARWRQLAGDDWLLLGGETTLALRRGQQRQALRGLRALLMRPEAEAGKYAFQLLREESANAAQTGRLLRALHAAGLVPAQPAAMLEWAGLAHRVKQPAVRDALLEAVARNWPEDGRVALAQAVVAREAGDWAQARQHLDAVRPRLDAYPELAVPVASEYQNLGDYATAAALLARLPQTPVLYGYRAQLLERAGASDGLARLYEELRALPDDASLHLLLGRLAERLERYPDALQWYGRVQDEAARGEAHLGMARVRFAQGEHEAAFALLGRMQRRELAVLAEAQQPLAYLLEAELWQKAGNAPAELDSYARALAAFPDDADILFARALAWERQDDIARAEADLRRILLKDAGNAAALNTLGYILADRTTRYREALALIERALAAEPGNAAIIDSHGWVLYRLGRHNKALVQLRRAFALFRDAEVAAHLAEVLWQSGKKDEARQYFTEAARIDPQNRALKRALDTLGISP